MSRAGRTAVGRRAARWAVPRWAVPRWAVSGWAVCCAVVLATTGGSSRARPDAPGRSSTVHAGVHTRVVRAGVLRAPGVDDVHVTVTEVTYAPGASSPPHLHDCAVVAYVAAGAVRSRSEGAASVVYRAGEAFLEAPGVLHVVSVNASRSAPATLVATSVCGRAPAPAGPQPSRP